MGINLHHHVSMIYVIWVTHLFAHKFPVVHMFSPLFLLFCYRKLTSLIVPT
jgi:hypothetical protein